MLKFVLGGSGSGKTTLLYQRVKARAEAGQRSILLVPEQFTSSTEGRIYRELGDALSGMVDSYSFTSLAEHILSAEGGAAVQTLSDAGRAVLVRRTLEELQATVGGYIETVTIATDAVIICNEEGRLQGLPHNCRIFGVDFVGPILIAGVDEDEFSDLDAGAMGALLDGWGRSIKNAET